MASPLQVDLSLAIQARVLGDVESLREISDARLYDCLAIVQAWKDDLVTEAQYRARIGEASEVSQVLSREGGRLAIVARRLRTS